jgi:ParB family chromosome partitioning protein
VQRVPIEAIDTSARNPRRMLGDLDELAASIEAHGLLQPVLVRRIGDRFELIAGHRRLEALRRLGWAEAPAIVRAADVDQAYVLTLVENLQRADLRPTEEAAALEILVRERGWTTRQVAAAINRSQAYVSKRLRVFDDPLLAPAVLANQLSVSAAEELLTLAEPRRYELLSEAVAHHWDREMIRSAARQRFAANQGRGARPPGLTRRIHQFRVDVRDVAPDQLTEADRRELRLLFSELTLLARAPTSPQRHVFPPLPGS